MNVPPALALALLGVAAAVVVVVVAVVAARARRGGSPERLEAVERAGLPEALAQLGFVAHSAGRYVRGATSFVALVRGGGEAREGEGEARESEAHVYAWDVRVECVRDTSLALERDVVATLERGPKGARTIRVRVEPTAGGARGVRDASPEDVARFGALIERHEATLASIGFIGVELYNHRSPKLHVRVRPPSDGAPGEFVARAVLVAEAMARDAAG